MTNIKFELDARLKNDTEMVGSLILCDVLMHKEIRLPWLILVPKKSNVREIHHLEPFDQMQLIRESSAIAKNMEAMFNPSKLNIASLGNIVNQLHIHHIARNIGDFAWPGPVWGAPGFQTHGTENIKIKLESMRSLLLEAQIMLNEASS